MAKDKIKYGLSNCYYAKGTESTQTANVWTYSTPVALPGAVSLTLDADGDNTTFHADNIKYWVGNNNQGYSGSLELALIPDQFKTDCLGELTSNKQVLLEDVDAALGHFALLFQFEGDKNHRRHVLYNCTASRPSLSGSTKADSIQPQTETINVSAAGEYNTGLSKTIVKASTVDTTDATTLSTWFTTVYQATALSA